MSNPRHPQSGLTLIELSISLAAVAILAVVATPSFSEMQKNALRRQSMNNFWHAIFLARNEAIKRNSVVALCKSVTGRRCDNNSSNWADGWIVFENLDRDEPAQVDNGEPILRIYNATEQIAVTSNRETFSFRPVTQNSANGTIVFCDSRGNGAARAIIISHTGRPRQSSKDASNQPLDCPTL
ncbi:MAG: GspH/FimT family pseudopilin [Steroidobacteraceae bacterium]